MIGVVYYCFLVNDWKELVLEQLNRLKKCGLYDSTDILKICVTLTQDDQENEFLELIKDFTKGEVTFGRNNDAEYLGIKTVKELGDKYDDLKIFYFHTKGVTNKFVRIRGNEISEEKVRNIKAWREMLEYFLIDNWKECIDKLDDFDNVGVTCNGGWYWGNFWWSNSYHIKRCREVNKWGRWDYESWLNHGLNNVKNYEFFHFSFNAYVTHIDEEWYKNPEKFVGKKMILHKAYYGTNTFEVDEGYADYELDKKVDITDYVSKQLESKNGLEFHFGVVNSILDEDPVWGHRKFAFIDFSFEDNPDKIYRIGCHEGVALQFKF